MPTIKNLLPGSPEPLGPTVQPDGINFAIHSAGATRIELLLFDNIADQRPSQVIPLAAETNRTGDVWHIFVEGLAQPDALQHPRRRPVQPGRRRDAVQRHQDADRPVCPGRSRATSTGSRAIRWATTTAIPTTDDRHLRPSAVDNVMGAPRCVAYRSDFDWEGDQHPDIPIEESIIYEVNVRGFTRHHSSESDLAGTYRGFIEKIPYLKELGITAVELLPVMEFDQFDGPFRDPFTGERLANAWGYNTVAFFAPESHYSYFGKLRRAGRRVQDARPRAAQAQHRGDPRRRLQPHARGEPLRADGQLPRASTTTSGTCSARSPSTTTTSRAAATRLNCNHPVVRQFILDCLRYWVTEMHVDGFRFDLAAVFAIDVDQQEKGKTPIIHEIETDPVLSRIKLIAEPWSIRQYRLGSFSDRRWAEWNGKFRDTVRKFVKGDAGVAGELATRVAGSYDLFAPDARLGAVAVPLDQFRDLPRRLHAQRPGLVQREAQRAQRRGQPRRHQRQRELELRLRRVRRALRPSRRGEGGDRGARGSSRSRTSWSLLFLSQGTPMLLYGDEMRRTAEGDNNTVFQDNSLNWINWENTKRHAEILRFTKLIIAFRKRHKIVRRWRYLTPDDVRDSDPAEHHLARGEAERGRLLRQLAVRRLGPRGVPDPGARRRADLRRLERLLGAADDRAPRRPKTGAGIASSTPRSPTGEDIVPEEEAFFLPEIDVRGPPAVDDRAGGAVSRKTPGAHSAKAQSI